jgi:flavodoxin
MKTLIVYYSRTGNARKVATALAEKLQADVEEIVPAKDYAGALGWMAAGKDSTFKSQPPIAAVKNDPAQYDLVIVGTPIWAFTAAAPIFTYLAEHGKACKSVAFYCTMGGNGDKRAYDDMAERSQAPKATMTILDKDLKAGNIGPSIAAFVEKLLSGPK